CCYGQPPDIHGIVRCVMPPNKVVDYQFDPMKIVGTLRVRPTVLDGYCVDIYQLEVDYVEVLEMAGPPIDDPSLKGPELKEERPGKPPEHHDQQPAPETKKPAKQQ